MTLPARPPAARDHEYVRLCGAHARWRAAVTAMHAGVGAAHAEADDLAALRELAAALRLAFHEYREAALMAGGRKDSGPGLVPAAFATLTVSLSLTPHDLDLIAAALDRAREGLPASQAGYCQALAAAFSRLPPDYYVLQPE